MELDVDRLAAEGVTFELERPFGRHRVVVGPSGGVSGQIATDPDGTFIDARTPDHLTLEELVWQLEAGAVEVDAQLALHEVTVELNVPRGDSATRGRVLVGRAESEHVSLEHATLGGEAIEATQPRIRGLSLKIEPEQTRIVIEEASFDKLVIPIAGEQVCLDDLHLENLRVQVPRGGGWDAQVERARSAGVELPLGTVHAVVAGFLIEQASTLGTSGLRAAHIGADRLDLQLRGLDESKREAKGSAPNAERRQGKLPLDLSFLDRLRGHIHLDLVTDIRIPVVRFRRATHAFRLAVEEGMIQYKRLEKGLARLEDAVLDFAIRKGRLVLEKDIPLVPFDRKTLVSWHLEPDELQLAEKGWVRLARLAAPKLEIASKPKKAKPSGEEGDGAIREIRVHGLDLSLGLDAHPGVALPNGTRLRLGGDGADSALEQLTIRGNVIYQPGRESEPTQLTIEAAGVVLGLADLPLGARHASVRIVRIAHLDNARLEMKGIRPASLEGRIEALTLRDFELTPPR